MAQCFGTLFLVSAALFSDMKSYVLLFLDPNDCFFSTFDGFSLEMKSYVLLFLDPNDCFFSTFDGFSLEMKTACSHEFAVRRISWMCGIN
ncbi:hypothetical protein C1646_775731 [Rhizophagus diaphanus]|nr:hypothetical protein C1646_775731 [Rhizophagus diaphanus] [Rhizophagus sp. MUCL 43196]